jgi:hypothetical protein
MASDDPSGRGSVPAKDFEAGVGFRDAGTHEAAVARLHEAGGAAQVVDRAVKAFSRLGEQVGSDAARDAPCPARPSALAVPLRSTRVQMRTSDDQVAAVKWIWLSEAW